MTFTVYASSTRGAIDRLGLVKGWDFPQFYAMGVLAAEGRVHELQSSASISAVVAARVAPEKRFRFVPVYGPQVALAFLPFAALPYTTARWVWVGVSLGLFILCVGALVGWGRGQRSRSGGRRKRGQR